MEPGGLIFLGIVVLWAVYLVPVWARDRAQASATRDAQRESERLRLTDRSQPRVLLTVGRPELTTSARITAIAAARRDLVEQRRGMRRRRATRSLSLLFGVVAVVGAVGAAAATTFPWWVAALAGGWVAAALVAGVAGAANDRRQLAAARSRARLAATLAPEVGVTARPVPLFDRGADPASQDVPRWSTAAGVDGVGGTWTPVSLPRPTYTMAARVTQAPVLPWVDVPGELPPVAEPFEAPVQTPTARPRVAFERRRSASA